MDAEQGLVALAKQVETLGHVGVRHDNMLEEIARLLTHLSLRVERLEEAIILLGGEIPEPPVDEERAFREIVRRISGPSHGG